ncbi:hypothetical protein QBC44DRAFT_53532 [Cladorrhinum sp. PSN332]|nr:hypothetical protein QBC44DRAFT_53532 [Cladorrhinum sp. PSN332]
MPASVRGWVLWAMWVNVLSRHLRVCLLRGSDCYLEPLSFSHPTPFLAIVGLSNWSTAVGPRCCIHHGRSCGLVKASWNLLLSTANCFLTVSGDRFAVPSNPGCRELGYSHHHLLVWCVAQLLWFRHRAPLRMCVCPVPVPC